MEKIGASELIINSDGSVFHLHVRPEHLADKVILVGDPGRVDMIATYLSDIESSTSSREFHSMTGKYKGVRMTVLSTGSQRGFRYTGGPCQEAQSDDPADRYLRCDTAGYHDRFVHLLKSIDRLRRPAELVRGQGRGGGEGY